MRIRFASIVGFSFVSVLALGCLASRDGAHDLGVADATDGDTGASDPCFGCTDENTCRGRACSDEGAMCRVAPYCGYVGSCTCSAGQFQCTYTDCFHDGCWNDTGSLAVTFRLTKLSLPGTAGFNLDGVNNANPPAGAGATIAGCGVVDFSGGVDDSLRHAAAALVEQLDLGAGFASLLAAPDPDGGVEAGTTIEITLSRLDSATVTNDTCVGVSLTLRKPGAEPVVVSGTGAMSNHVVNLTLDAPLRLEVPLSAQVPPTSCAGGVCQPGALAVTVHGARIRLVLDAANRDVLPGSAFGGYAFFSDSDPSYAGIQASGLEAALSDFVSQVGVDATFASTLSTAFRDARDLHMEPNGTSSPCSGSSPTEPNANSVSLALDLAGTAL